MSVDAPQHGISDPPMGRRVLGTTRPRIACQNRCVASPAVLGAIAGDLADMAAHQVRKRWVHVEAQERVTRVAQDHHEGHQGTLGTARTRQGKRLRSFMTVSLRTDPGDMDTGNGRLDR